MSELRPYECMVIFDADLEEENIRSDVEKWMSQLESAGAERGYVDIWGKRRLAYEINHRSEGFYVVFQAKAPPGAVDALNRALSLSDDVIRHKVLRVPEEVYGPPERLRSAATDA